MERNVEINKDRKRKKERHMEIKAEINKDRKRKKERQRNKERKLEIQTNRQKERHFGADIPVWHERVCQLIENLFEDVWRRDWVFRPKSKEEMIGMRKRNGMDRWTKNGHIWPLWRSKTGNLRLLRKWISIGLYDSNKNVIWSMLLWAILMGPQHSA